jgi:GntR family transcriptional regulator, arabinose operon transcriptional repressor
MLDELPSVDKADPLPRHIQVQRILRDMVSSGNLKPGDKIPAEVDIAVQMGVSKMTVNKALLALTASGLFVREVGRGTFVAAPPSPEELAAGAETTRPRVAISFVEGARNVLQSDYYGNLYRGVVEALDPHLTTAPATNGDGRHEPVDLLLSALAARDYVAEDEREPAAGRLIIAPRSESIASIEALWQRGKAVIVVGASWPAMGVPSVDSDNIGGAAEAVQHLVDLGHRNVAMLVAEEETANIQDRLTGYRRTLARARLPHRDEWEVRASEMWRIGEEARARLTALLTGPDPVTAIFAAGHYLALDAANVIREAGLRIPDDVSVIGYDDPVSAQLVYPPLTTIRQPLAEMGQRAAERLLRIVFGRESRNVIREMLPAQLVTRRSTAPRKGAA